MIYLGLGTNLGDRMANLREALTVLEERGVGVLACSPVFETPAWGGVAGFPFYNAVAEVSFHTSAPELLDILLSVESDLGRVRERKWGDRLIDLDLLEFHRQTWDHPCLQLPHPAYPSRAFVVVPFAAFRPGFRPTGSHDSLGELASRLETRDICQVATGLCP